MIGLSQAGLAAVHGPHTVSVEVDVYRNHELIAARLPVTGGEVKADRTQNIRRTAVVRLADRRFLPVFATDPLTPYGQEMVIRYGVKAPGSAAPEWVQLGVFVLRSVTWDEPTGAFTVEAADRTSRLTEAFGLPHPWVQILGTAENYRLGTVPLGPMIDLLVTHRAGGVFYGDVGVFYDPGLPNPPATRSPKGLIIEDRWETGIVAAARLLGGEVYADHLGDFRVVVPPKVTDAPVASIDAGPGGVLVSARRGLTRERVYNLVTVRSQMVGSTAHATVYDNDPTSPTYPGLYTGIAGRAADVTNGAYTGTQAPYGEVHLVVDSAISATVADCEHEARIRLHNQLGLLRSVEIGAVPNPALEPGDVVTISYADGSTENHLLDSLTIPLGVGGGWTATTRTHTHQLADA